MHSVTVSGIYDAIRYATRGPSADEPAEVITRPCSEIYFSDEVACTLGMPEPPNPDAMYELDFEDD